MLLAVVVLAFLLSWFVHLLKFFLTIVSGLVSVLPLLFDEFLFEWAVVLLLALVVVLIGAALVLVVIIFLVSLELFLRVLLR